MKKVLFFIMSIILSFSSYIYAKDTMNLFIAVNYTNDEIINAFEKKCNCTLEQTFFNDPNELLAKITAGSSGYDVIEATSYAVEELVHMNKLQKLDKGKIIGLNNIAPQFMNPPYDKENLYSIPYAYTPVFLAFNEKKMKELNIKPDTWAVIFEAKYLKKLKDHVTVFSSSRNVFAAALLYLGKNPNSTNVEDLNAARKLIDKASPYWAKFDTDSYYRGLLRGDIWLSMSYSIDIFKAIQDAKAINSPIKIGVMMQKEGNMYEMDNLVIPKDAPNLNFAYDFINTILNPKSAHSLAVTTGTSIPNQVGYNMLDSSIKNILWIYPKNPKKNFTFTAYDPKTRILVNEMWTEIQMQCHDICDTCNN